MNGNANKKKRRNDIILIVFVLLVATAGTVYLHFFRSTGDCVTVTVDGTEYGVYLLSENRTEDIFSGDGEQHHNRLVIKDGKAFMEKASCPDGICVAHAPVFRDGESIICLPNRVVVTVDLVGESDDPDIIM